MSSDKGRQNMKMMQDNIMNTHILSHKQTSGVPKHTQKVVLKNVEAKLKKRGEQLSVPLETKMATT
jgi:hypothetical protein